MQVGRSVPDRLSRDAWRVINSLGDAWTSRCGSALPWSVWAIAHCVAAFAGLSTGMSRGQAGGFWTWGGA
jgi:hypothetical protein